MKIIVANMSEQPLYQQIKELIKSAIISGELTEGDPLPLIRALAGKEISKNKRELKNHIGVVLDEGCFYEEMTLNEMKNIIASAYSNWDEESFKNYIKQFELPLNKKI